MIATNLYNNLLYQPPSKLQNYSETLQDFLEVARTEMYLVHQLTALMMLLTDI